MPLLKEKDFPSAPKGRWTGTFSKDWDKKKAKRDKETGKRRKAHDGEIAKRQKAVNELASTFDAETLYRAYMVAKKRQVGV